MKFAAGQFAEDAGIGQDVAEAQACSSAEVALLLDIRERVMIAQGRPEEDIPRGNCLHIGGTTRADGRCTMHLSEASANCS